MKIAFEAIIGQGVSLVITQQCYLILEVLRKLTQRNLISSEDKQKLIQQKEKYFDCKTITKVEDCKITLNEKAMF